MDLSKYDFTKTPENWKYNWCMDDLHILALNKMAIHCAGNVVEVGCFKGRSTTAFTEALNNGADFILHLVDLKISDELKQVISMCRKPENIIIHETHSTEFRITDQLVSLFSIDGDHNFAACQDVLNAIASNAQIIAMHDTQAHPQGFDQCEGAYVSANALKAWRNRRYLEDFKLRKDQWTHRGFLASFSATAPQEAYNACKAALDVP